MCRSVESSALPPIGGSPFAASSSIWWVRYRTKIVGLTTLSLHRGKVKTAHRVVDIKEWHDTASNFRLP